jgi:hypothetical protein
MSEDTKKLLSADDILNAEDLEVEELEVPEWKGIVHLRVLPADEGLELSGKMAALTKEEQHESLFLLLGACLVDAQGQRMFSTTEQLKRLRTRSQKVLLRIQEKALELQGWTVDANVGKGA